MIEQQLSKDCNKLSKWMKANRLKLNHDKTKVMTMGTRQRLTNTRPLNVQIDGVMLKQKTAESEHLLGCQIQSDIKWTKLVSLISDILVHFQLRKQLQRESLSV